MIRKNSLLCKLNRIKTSSKSLFHTYMQHFQPHLETCPICGSTGNCHIHDYYGRSIVDLRSEKKSKEELCILRVFCESCGHAHAVLPDFIIPYSSYSLFFILYVLGQYFARLAPVEQICERSGISGKQLFKWLALWKSHKQIWLGILVDSETTDKAFWQSLQEKENYSFFSSDFTRLTSHSFLQSHANPVLSSPPGARYCQKVFAPDISIF